MSNVRISSNGVYYIEEIKYSDLAYILDNGYLFCDECGVSLIGNDDIVLIPYIHYNCCKKCAYELLSLYKIGDYYSQSILTEYYIKEFKLRGCLV